MIHIFQGQFFSGNDYKIYLLGNPIIWWLNLLMLFFYPFIVLIIVIRRKRCCDEIPLIEKENQRFLSASIWIFIGWCLHYFPFYAMGRVLYFHHYFPAAIFSSMLTAIILDYLFNTLPILMLYIVYHQKSTAEIIDPRYQSARLVFHFIYGTFISAIAYSFYLFSPLAYGIIRLLTSVTSTGNSSTGSSIIIAAGAAIGSKSTLSTDDLNADHIDYSSEQQMKSLRWMDSWEF